MKKSKLKVGDKVWVIDNAVWGTKFLEVEEIRDSGIVANGGFFKFESLISEMSPEGLERFNKIKEYNDLAKELSEMRKKLFGDSF